MKKIIRFLLILFLIITVTIIYARYEATKGLITKENNITTDKIDNSFDGLKIVHFSDLHYPRLIDKNKLDNILKEINLINPDIVIFTGDLVDKDFNITEKDNNNLIDFLSNIKSKYGNFAIMGNHDYQKDEEDINNIYNESNFILLKNSYDVIYGEDNDKLFIGGLDSYSYNKADISKVMNYFNDNEDISYKIILVHEPDYIDKITDSYDINLVLAGHSHNGQVNIPYLKNLFLPDKAHKYYKNHYEVNGTDLYISSGIGMSKINFRLFNRPSINFYRINKNT